ncbi:unnamed protein product [Brassica oleracea var. botrytis]
MQQRQPYIAEHVIFLLKSLLILLQNEKAFLKQPKLEEILEGNRYVKQICRFTSVCFSPLFYISFVCLPTCVCVTRSSIRYLELGVNLSTFSFDDQV